MCFSLQRLMYFMGDDRMLSLDLWRFAGLDPYRLFYPILIRMDPEKAHTFALKLLEKGMGPKDKANYDPILLYRDMRPEVS